MSFANLEIERTGPIATVWLNRPRRANALNRELMEELAHAAESFHDDIDTRVVIIAGRGRHFSAGADLGSAVAETNPDEASPSKLRQRRNTVSGPRLIRALLDINQITIAAVQSTVLHVGIVASS